ncbi:hypothetical protein MUY27_12930 [Mucilaginibacter sp. RS28]|uniref:Lipoprotein n=1 Tax=Mucilaginibacter straminoryzae TaxID=2932774 RepID=A0A9X2BAB4_9SPHI|nr:hypothetical protein [Mucilaginibacter straminoryzae]MCJ8210615.1 hypothetical protein [Mucilaginibacter straminoryzae]
MKKLFCLMAVSCLITLSACNHSGAKTGNDRPDSGTAGSSGPADTTTAPGTGSTMGTSTGGSDTSNNGKGVANPTADTVRH